MINVKGKTVVLTGSFPGIDRSVAKCGLIAAGAKVVGSVSSKVDTLFHGHRPGSKLTKARALGIEVYNVVGLREAITKPKPHYMLRSDRWHKYPSLESARLQQKWGPDPIFVAPTIMPKNWRQKTDS